ncbi:MAG TPA: hypothetical protein VFE98_01130 [Candidatus Bathyarchaeia archaeon]|nr:hypothetical protein [Candidatus Bathyarchaeia archaeon]
MSSDDSIPRESIKRFFASVESRAWTDAEKELDSIRQDTQNAPWTKGYVKALEGLLLTYRNDDDKYIFLPKALANNSEETVKSLKKEFGEFAINDLHGEYDRGYFRALEDYLEAISAGKSGQSQAAPSQRRPDQNVVTEQSSSADHSK